MEETRMRGRRRNRERVIEWERRFGRRRNDGIEWWRRESESE